MAQGLHQEQADDDQCQGKGQGGEAAGLAGGLSLAVGFGAVFTGLHGGAAMIAQNGRQRASSRMTCSRMALPWRAGGGITDA